MDKEDYKYLYEYTKPVIFSEREIIGRENIMRSMLAAFGRYELSNVILLGDAGSGKSATVQGLAKIDTKREYLEVDLSKMIAGLNNSNEMAHKLKALFDDVILYRKNNNKEIVLFMDEFHQVVQLSDAAVEALKPLLAKGGTQGVRLIAATTYDEFREYISDNLPLVERLQRINIPQADKKLTVDILKGMVKTYGLEDQFYNDHIFELIYEYTQRYVPASSQPRKSLLVLDAMCGWYNTYGKPLDVKLLGDVIYESQGVNVAFRVDGSEIKKKLDAKVFAQDFATTTIADRLQICVADLNNKDKPMSSFLFTGSTGVGKGIIDDAMIPIWKEDGSIAYKRNGDLEIGDYVFDRVGNPTQVKGVFPQGLKDIYRVTLSDDRFVDVDDSHLWAVYPNRQSRDDGFTIYSTKTLLNKGIVSKQRNNRIGCKYKVPVNKAVTWPMKDLKVDPYVMGVLLGDGCLTMNELSISSVDKQIVNYVRDSIGAIEAISPSKSNYNWYFIKDDNKRIKLREVLGYYDDLIGSRSLTKIIPDDFKTGSIEQRWSLIQGLFDTDGTIGQNDGERYNVSLSTSNKSIAYDVQRILWSLGVMSTIGISDRKDRANLEYCVRVKCLNEDKNKFFRLSPKYDVAKNLISEHKQRVKSFDAIGIKSIEKLPYQSNTTCIMVDNDEHLYLTDQFIVTHNTEVTKQLANILFNDNRKLINFDMSEFANPSSMDRFKDELTAKIWANPYCILLFDEIEKSCGAVTRLLLQVLDNARLTDRNGREVTFSNAYIVLTTNAGSEIYKIISQYLKDDTGSEKNMVRYDNLIRRSLMQTTGENKFPPELLGRIDCIVPFQPLSEATMRKIAKTKLNQLISKVQHTHGIRLLVDDKVIKYLVDDQLTSDSNSGGARRVVSQIERDVTKEVAKFINENKLLKYIGVTVQGKMYTENKNMLESEARIVVVDMETVTRNRKGK